MSKYPKHLYKYIQGGEGSGQSHGDGRISGLGYGDGVAQFRKSTIAGTGWGDGPGTSIGESNGHGYGGGFGLGTGEMQGHGLGDGRCFGEGDGVGATMYGISKNAYG